MQPLGSLSPELQSQFDALGPRWAEDINRHRDFVVQAYTPLVRAADNAGIEVARDLPYGSAARQVLDVYSRPAWVGQRRDVLVFFHGGAFIRGSKSANGAVYDNVAYWFARQGCVALNVEYRLAPDTPYPGGAHDVVAAVRWVQLHIAGYGGDPARIFLMGHSAGGAHVASALFDPALVSRLTDAEIAGALLVSARLRADVLPDNPNAAGVRAYFGEDDTLYDLRSPASHAGLSNVPLFVAVAQYENPHLDTYGRAFHANALASGRTAPAQFMQLPRHNHTSIVAHFNSGEETLGPQLLQFMQATRGAPFVHELSPPTAMTIPASMPRVLAPALTPFNADLSVNQPAFIAFCRWLVAQGAGLAVFGTNSEANSLSLSEKLTLLEALVEAGLPPTSIVPGTGLCALPETIALTRRAVDLGCAGTLTLPPFYFKPAAEEGLFAYYAQLIEAVGSSRLKLYLYHIPQFTGVPISCALIERLRAAYPDTVVGIKDSSGDWANTERMLREFPGFAVYPASEALLEKALPLGAAGCISATANVQPRAIAQAIAQWGTPQFEPAQAGIKTVRMLFQAQPMIPALKHIVAQQFGDARWRHVRAPLVAADPAWADGLSAQLAQAGFRMDATA